jgi:hypothetical protein
MVKLDGALSDGQAKPQTSTLGIPGLVNAEEGIEDAWEQVLWVLLPLPSGG